MILQVSSLGLFFGEKEIFSDVSFSVSEGEIVSVLGPNGAGKTSLLRCILGQQKKYAGKIDIQGVDLLLMNEKKRAEFISYVSQLHQPDFSYNVFETVLMGRTRYLSLFETPKKEDEAEVLSVLEKFSLSHLSERRFSSLSGGEQQLTLIARAFIQKSRLILMDEPTSALDFGNQKKILREIASLKSDGIAVLMSTHHPQHALDYADKVLVLNHGKVEAFGNPKEVLTKELMKQVYGINVTFTDVNHQRIIITE